MRCIREGGVGLSLRIWVGFECILLFHRGKIFTITMKTGRDGAISLIVNTKK